MANLTIRTLEKRLAPLREADLVPPTRGWLRAIREGFGMTTKQLASRIGVVPSRITALEKAEITGGTTLRSLREAAEAMGCVFVYAIVPVQPMDETLRARAVRLAEADLDRTSHTMRLEDQALDAAGIASERERLIEEYLAGPSRRLWDRT